ncbi:tripartite tricarboxylate transporter substrate binding protein [Alcaligenaceae bacterium]|nr:tripartite tricarboxylate transporter substrate binding protein [Alcaligenaceae bacterium]
MKKLTSKLLPYILCMPAMLLAPLALAQSFPSKPIHIVIPAAAGGSTDTIGRILAKLLSEQSGVPVVVENKAGASGSIGVNSVVQSAPDGYTLLVSVPDAVTVYPLMTKNAPYKSTDLTPITSVASTPYVFAMNAQLPANTLQDFIALSKKQQLSMATPGTGTSGRIVLEMFKHAAGIDLLHVPYKGAGPAMLSVIAGETQIAATSPMTLKSHMDSGKLKALAVSSATRNSRLPNVPSMVESGFPGFDVSAWFGVFTAPGVPADVAEKLNKMILTAIKSPEYTSRINGLGLEIKPVSLGQFKEMLAQETKRWGQLIKSAGITPGE